MTDQSTQIRQGSISFWKMKAKETWRICRIPFYFWIFVSSLSLTFAPNGCKNLFERAALYFDAGHYTEIARDGYFTESLAAFYPLWPLFIRFCAIITGYFSTSPLILGGVTSLLASIFFIGATIVLVAITDRHELKKFRSFVLAIMILSPLSLFRVLPFTESLFSFLLMLLIWDLGQDYKLGRVIRCGLWAFLLSATRPMFPFLIIAAILVGLLVNVSSKRDSTQQAAKTVLYKRLLAIVFGAPLGYLPFGYVCFRVYGNFWMPFVAQAQWGRKLGLHWDLIVSPKVINGSNEVLVWDLFGFYLPVVLMIAGLVYLIRSKGKLSPSLVAVFFMSVLIGMAHSAAAFLTFDRFMSIGRHVLANPLGFLGILIALQFISEERHGTVKNILKFLLLASAVFLGMWWFRFARDQWIG